jgi:hypothetical protein
MSLSNLKPKQVTVLGVNAKRGSVLVLFTDPFFPYTLLSRQTSGYTRSLWRRTEGNRSGRLSYFRLAIGPAPRTHPTRWSTRCLRACAERRGPRQPRPEQHMGSNLRHVTDTSCTTVVELGYRSNVSMDRTLRQAVESRMGHLISTFSFVFVGQYLPVGHCLFLSHL